MCTQHLGTKPRRKKARKKGDRNGAVKPGPLPAPHIPPSFAKKKVDVYLGLHWGQNFSVDDPVLQGKDRSYWVVPVWYATPREGRKEKMLDVTVDAQTGELVDEENLRRALDRIGA